MTALSHLTPEAATDALFAVASGAVDPAASLTASAALFDRIGDTFSAAFTRDMVAGAEAMPSLYVHYARQQADRAARKIAALPSQSKDAEA